VSLNIDFIATPHQSFCLILNTSISIKFPFHDRINRIQSNMLVVNLVLNSDQLIQDQEVYHDDSGGNRLDVGIGHISQLAQGTWTVAILCS